MIILQILIFVLEVANNNIGRIVVKFLLTIFSGGEKFFFVDKIYDFQDKKTITRLVLLLPGKGCEWAKKTGGCSMCDFSKRSREIGKNFSSNGLIALYKIAVNLTENEKPLNLTIYNGGSFLNDNEIPFDTQLKICHLANKHSSIKKLFIESRVEFITEDKIKLLKQELKNKTLIIGIGLESQDDKIRNVFIKKGLSKENYEKTIEILKKNNIRVSTYVLLKPIYLAEKEAIEEAVKTIKYAFDKGTNEVALEIAFIQEDTLMGELFKEKKYKPPWLWSVIEVVKKTKGLGSIHVGGFRDFPPPIAVSYNCDFCSLRIKNALQQYREKNDISLLNNLRCDCYKSWEKEISESSYK